MVCLMPRMAPNIAYFLFDLHPIIIKGYTPKLKIIMKKIIENIELKETPLTGISPQRHNIKNKLKIGPILNIKILALNGNKTSFKKSLIASANG